MLFVVRRMVRKIVLVRLVIVGFDESVSSSLDLMTSRHGNFYSSRLCHGS